MIRLPPISTRTDTPLPCTPRFRSHHHVGAGELLLEQLFQRCVVIEAVVAGALRRHRLRIAGEEAVGDGGTIDNGDDAVDRRSEEHPSELHSLMRISYAVFCLKKKNTEHSNHPKH